MVDHTSPEDIFIPQSSKIQNLRFIKDEHGEMQPKILSDAELEEYIQKAQESERERGIALVVCDGHIGNIAIQLAHTLSSHTIDREVILIQKPEHIHPIGEIHQLIQIKDIGQKIMCVLSMQEELPNQEPLVFKIQKTEEFQEIFLAKPNKTWKKTDKFYTPKPQKAKRPTARGYRTTKK